MIQPGDGSANPILQDVVAQNQTVNSAASVTMQLRGQATATVQITAIGSQTFVFEGSTDGVNFYALNATPIAGGSVITSTTSTGQWAVNVAGMFQFRVRCSVYVSGSATVNVICSNGVAATAGVPSAAGVTQGSTTAGQSGPLVQGAVTTAAPSYTTAQTDPLSLTTAGGLRTDIASVNATALGTPTNFGSTPGAVIALQVNSSAFVGTTAAVAASAGVQKVGITGNAGAAFDQASGSAVPANAIMIAGGSVAGGTTTEAVTVKAASTAAAATDTSLVVQPLVNSHTMNTAAAGTQLVGVVGNAAAAFDQASGSAVPANCLMVAGGSVAGGTNTTAMTVKAASTAAAATDTSLVVQPLVGSHVMNTAAAGTQLVGISGATAATLDAVITAAAAPANAIAVLSVNNTTAPSLTTGQSVAQQCDYEGSIFVKPYRRGQTAAKATTIANTSSATAVTATPSAGIFADLSGLIITVLPTTATAPAIFTATLSDGTNSFVFNMTSVCVGVSTTAASGTVDKLAINFDPPIPIATAALAWTIALSVATVTVNVTTVVCLQKAS